MARTLQTQIKLDTSAFVNALKEALGLSEQQAGKIEKSLSSIKAGIDVGAFKKGLKDAEDAADKSAGSIMAKFKEKLKGGSISDALIGGLVGGGVAGIASSATSAIVGGFKEAINIGADFEQSLAGVSAVTGITGNGLQDIGNRARDLAKQFGGEAKDQLAGFQTTLSRFGADLAQSPEALGKFAENANLLAKAGGLAADQGVDALTTAMLQFKVNVTDPNTVIDESSRFINALAASARVGAAEIPQVVDAIKVAGVAASGANVSFEETNAAIQILAAGGKVGAEAGTSLRNVLGSLTDGGKDQREALKNLGTSYEELGDVLTTKGFGPAMELLKEKLAAIENPAQKSAIMMKLFGKENQSSAQILIDGSGTMQEWTKEITGTQDAITQAAVNMNTFNESMSRLWANIKDLAIPIFNALSAAATFLINQIRPIIDNILPALGGAFERIWSILQPILALLAGVFIQQAVFWFTVMAEQVRLVADMLVDLYDAVVVALQPLTDLFGGVGEGVDVMKLFEDILEGTRIAVQGFFGVLSEVAKLIINVLLAPLNVLIGVFRSIYDAVFPATESLEGAKDAIAGTGKETEKAKTFLEKLKGVFDVLRDAVAGVTGAFKFITETVKAFVQQLTQGNVLDALKAFAGFGDNVAQAYKSAAESNASLRQENEKLAAQESAFAELRRKIDEAGRKNTLTGKALEQAKAELAQVVAQAFAQEQISEAQQEQLRNMINIIGVKERDNRLNGEEDEKQKSRYKLAEEAYKAEKLRIQNRAADARELLKLKRDAGEITSIEYNTQLGEVDDTELKALRDNLKSKFDASLDRFGLLVEIGVKAAPDASLNETDSFVRQEARDIAGRVAIEIPIKPSFDEDDFIRLQEQLRLRAKASQINTEVGLELPEEETDALTDALTAVAEAADTVFGESADNITESLVDSFNAIGEASDEATQKELDNIQSQEDALIASLQKREASLESFNEKSAQLAEERAKLQSKDSLFGSSFKAALKSTAEGLSTTFAAVRDQFVDVAKFAIKSSKDVDGMSLSLNALGKAATLTFGANLASALADGETNFAELLQTLVSSVQTAIDILLPAIIAQYSVFEGPLGLALAVGLYATLKTMLSAAAGAIGAETGVVGITKSYSKARGRTDTIPLWVAEGETIHTREATKHNRDLFAAIQRNPASWYKDGSIRDSLLKKLGVGKEAGARIELTASGRIRETERGGIMDKVGPKLLEKIDMLTNEVRSLRTKIKTMQEVHVVPHVDEGGLLSRIDTLRFADVRGY